MSMQGFPMVNDRIRRVQLLWMPDDESLEALGDAAGYFEDGYWGGAVPDGDLLLAPVSAFNKADLAAALAAGGKVVDGYEFMYPRSVEVSAVGWCGYNTAGVGYALQRDVAVAVWAASIALAKQA